MRQNVKHMWAEWLKWKESRMDAKCVKKKKNVWDYVDVDRCDARLIYNFLLLFHETATQLWLRNVIAFDFDLQWHRKLVEAVGRAW